MVEKKIEAVIETRPAEPVKATMAIAASAGSDELFHIEYPRILPERRPTGHKPAAPRYTLRWPQAIGILVSQYHSIQSPDLRLDQRSAFFDMMIGSFAESDGPSTYETMTFIDEQGEHNAVVASYWLDATAHARWNIQSTASRWFADAERMSGPIGCWRETISVPYDRHETIYSEPHYKIGLARTRDAAIVAMTTNGYFGAARDRLPISAIDPLDSPLAHDPPQQREVESRGRRLVATAPHNMTALRSGQFWQSAKAEQLADYVNNMEPKLMRGMDYLASNKIASGTLSLRVMTNLDSNGDEKPETSVLAYFLSLEQLEEWAKSHDTHLEIYRHAIAMNRKFKNSREVVTWHELFVLPACSTFEYVNCHPKTGLLPFVPVYRVA